MVESGPVWIVTVGAMNPVQEAWAAMPVKPEFALFVCSAASRANLECATPVARHEVIEISNADDFAGIVEELRRDLLPKLRPWANRRLIFDYTGGTKCMTAALVLVTRRLAGTFQYIGGQRTGTTNIETGTGKALRADNPWDALGYQAVEEAVTLFDHGSPAAAALLLQRARRHATGEVAEALETFEFVIRLYAEWDRFEHGRALEVGSEWRVRLGRLGRFFPPAGVAGLEAILGSDLEYLRKIVVANRMSRELVLDLVANAMRRMAEQRFDDAVARLYRATEALGQTELWERHSIDAGKVRPEQIPEKLRRHYERQGKPGRPLRLGLRQDYELLRELGNPLGLRFRESVLSAPDEQSPLGGRNRSILAHGFRPLADPDANHLLKAVLELAEVKGADLPLFPKLGEMLL